MKPRMPFVLRFAHLWVIAMLFAATTMAASAQQATVQVEGWAAWAKNEDPVFGGQYVAADPSVILDNGLYRMFYTCIDPSGKVTNAEICEATSSDGLSWTNIPAAGAIEGLVLAGRPGAWDEHLETSLIVKRGDQYLLYYSGYQTDGLPVIGFPASLGLATSTDGITFTRVQDQPILSPTDGALDNDAVYGPTIVEHDGQLVMIYAGHCYNNCPTGEDSEVTLLAATSTDGITWTKQAEPVLAAVDELDWMKDGVSDPDLVQGPDGRFYLFFTGVLEDTRTIGAAVSDSPLGPWMVDAAPIILPSNTGVGFDAAGAVAPTVLFENDRARMWYRGTGVGDEGFAIGYAEAPLPIVG
jgi:predicted GH43/DUF377 family glycosyl hydrolase